MTYLEGVLIGFLAATVVVWWRGRDSCGGGHVWSERKPTQRYRITPYSYRPWKVGVERLHRETCQRGQCRETRDHWEHVGDVNPGAFEDAVKELIEEYEVPDDG